MSNPVKLTVDRQNQTLVNLNGTVVNLPGMFQGNVRDFQIQIVDPTGGFSSQYQIVDASAYTLRLSIGDTPTGTLGGPAELTFQDTWVWDATNKWFTGSLNLNVAAINAFIGSAASKSAYFELNLIDANEQTIFQSTVVLHATVYDTGATTPAPADQYFTKAQALALFAKLVGANGQRIVLASPSGVYGRELGCNDDGSALDNSITL